MKKLVINALSALHGGGQTNIINLLNHFPLYDCQIILIVNTKNVNLFSKYKSKKVIIYESKFASKSLFSRLFWEKYILSSKLKKWNCKIYYSPGGTLLTNVPENCIGITTLQNMLPFDDNERKRFPFFSFLRYKMLFLKYIYIKSYKLTDKVIFISNYSMNIVEKIIPDITNKSTIIPLGVSENFLKSNKIYNLPRDLIDNQFYLYVSQLDYYKSQKQLIYSWQKLISKGFNKKLVFAGSNKSKYGDEVLSLIKELNLEKYIIYLGEVDYDKLPSLYRSAQSLIFASSCECCPNTLLEMMSFKKTIFCSNMNPMPEFGENGVVYFDPYSPNELVNQILKFHNNEELNNKYSDKAFELSKKYNSKNTIIKYIDYILDVK